MQSLQLHHVHHLQSRNCTTCNRGRPLSAIAADVYRAWREEGLLAMRERPTFITHASDYLGAMHTMQSVHETYGAQSGSRIVALALDNLGGWRSPNARKLKAELRALLRH